MDQVWGLGEACQIHKSSIKSDISTGGEAGVIRKNMWKSEGRKTFKPVHYLTKPQLKQKHGHWFPGGNLPRQGQKKSGIDFCGVQRV